MKLQQITNPSIQVTCVTTERIDRSEGDDYAVRTEAELRVSILHRMMFVDRARIHPD